MLPKGKKNDNMQAVIQINDENGLHYFDGARLHQLQYPDELTALRMTLAAAVKDLPAFKIGTNGAPWGTRLMDVFGR